MNLLIIMPSGQLRGGAEEALLQYVSCSVQAGKQPLVVVLEDGPIIPALRKRNAKVIHFDAGQLRQANLWFKTIWKIKNLVQVEKIDFILSWMTKAHLYASPAAKLCHKPAAYFQMGLPDDSLVDRLCRRLPAVGALGCSNFVALEQGQHLPYRVLPVHLAADLTRFQAVRQVPVASMKSQLGFDPLRPLVGMVGRLQHWKGMHVFIEAFAEVWKTSPDVQGVIVGGQHIWEAEYESFLQQKICELGVGDALKMVGVQRNVPEWMQAMDVFVHASQTEPFGIVIVEAMSLGKPVIATIPGGPAEIIEPDVSGQLVPWDDVEKLTGAIQKFLAEKDFAAHCGVAAEKRSHLFSTEKFYQTLNSALGELLTESQKSSTKVA